MSTDWSNTKSRHGTPSGWSKHKELGEDPCDACYRARQEYDKQLRSAPAKTQKARINARAQNKAEGHLARLYPEQYAELYAMYKERFIREAAHDEH